MMDIDFLVKMRNKTKLSIHNDMIDSVLEEVYEKGFDDGFDDGYDTGFDDGMECERDDDE